jgi:AcrR family transcriptional regulator
MTTRTTGRIALNERKRLRAMRHVQEVALDLFDEEGFDAVTIDRIAEAAEVSLSSIYRYFGTKEGIVLWNPQQVELAEIGARVRDGLAPLEAVRRIAAEALAEPSPQEATSHRRRVRYMMEAPSVHGALAQHLSGLSTQLAAWLGERAGRDPRDLDLQVTCSALFGGLMGAMRHWHATGYTEPLLDVLDRTLTQLQNGLDLQ